MPFSSLSPRRHRAAVTFVFIGFIVVIGGFCWRVRAARVTKEDNTDQITLVTGKGLTPVGTQTPVGSFPANVVLSPDGRWALVSSLGSRAFVSVLDARTGRLVSRVGFNGPRTDGALDRSGKPYREGLYYGLAFGPRNPVDSGTPVYAARGTDDAIGVLRLAADGTLTKTGRTLDVPSGAAPGKAPLQIAGISVSGDGRTLFAAANTADPAKQMRGSVALIDTATGSVRSQLTVPGYPFVLAALTTGPASGRKLYVGGEQRDLVSVIDPDSGSVVHEITTGSHPMAFTLDRAQSRLYVANAGSDTVTVIRTDTDTVEQTILLRPSDARGLPAATPTGVTLAPDDKTLYVTLADLNAVAVVDTTRSTVTGYVPVGWYPTSLCISSDGARLFVANAKGTHDRNPNAKPVPVAFSGPQPQYIENILEGTASTITLAEVRQNLPALTAQVLRNNRIQSGLLEQARTALKNPGIEHVIYIIKENRTYDEILGDMKPGDGDPSLALFGRDVTPNLHALASRFVLLDNFYCCAEVSGDGWNWSTSGMASEFVQRNVAYGYAGRSHPYDYEGTNNGLAVDRANIPDAATAPGGYLWDAAARAVITYRNYGCFTDDLKLPRETAEEGSKGLDNAADKTALAGHTDADYREFDMDYADSDAWVRYALPARPKQKATYGAHAAPSRVSEWRHEFDGFVQNGALPRLSMIRLGNDHAEGTKPGAPSPRAHIADNDYAVGQIVEAVSHSLYWKSTAVVIVEDDAQSGFDHVDAHRSIAFVISPFVRQSSHDNRFYNTDSILHTIENLLGIESMSHYDATAPTLNVFTARPENDAPYDAILPALAIIAERNKPGAYRAADSARLIDARVADAVPDETMNDILWHAIKGRNVPAPAPRHARFGVTPEHPSR